MTGERALKQRREKIAKIDRIATIRSEIAERRYHAAMLAVRVQEEALANAVSALDACHDEARLVRGGALRGLMAREMPDIARKAHLAVAAHVRTAIDIKHAEKLRDAERQALEVKRRNAELHRADYARMRRNQHKLDLAATMIETEIRRFG